MEQLAFDFNPDQGLIRLSEARRLLEEAQVIDPAPVHATLIAWIESALVDGVKLQGLWYVRRGSFHKLVRRLRDAEAGSEVK